MKRTELKTCTIHGDECHGRQAALARREHAAFLRKMKCDPGEWDDDGWTPELCVQLDQEERDFQMSFAEDYDEERWKKMNPGKAYPGFVPDLACKQGSKVWKGGYVHDPRTGQEGPIIRNKSERDEYCKLTGHRALEPREVPVSKENGMKAIAKELGAKCADYYRRMHS